MSAIPVMFRSLAMSSLAVLLVASSAEARFGKKSSDGDSGNSNRSERAEQGKPATSHAATPVRSEPVVEHHHEHRSSGPSVTYVAPAPCCYEPAYASPRTVYVPVYEAREPVAAPYVERSNEPPPAYVPRNHMILAAELNPVNEGIGMAASLRLDGVSWGFSIDGRLLTLAADDGSANVDSIQLANAHLTYALLSGEQGKLRLEAGAASAFAPDLIVFGPSIGTTVLLNLSPWFGLEGGVHGTPFPFRRFEWNAGAQLGLGPLGLHAGWRVIALDDAGLVDGVSHQDVLAGPYAAASLTF